MTKTQNLQFMPTVSEQWVQMLLRTTAQ